MNSHVVFAIEGRRYSLRKLGSVNPLELTADTGPCDPQVVSQIELVLTWYDPLIKSGMIQFINDKLTKMANAGNGYRLFASYTYSQGQQAGICKINGRCRLIQIEELLCSLCGSASCLTCCGTVD